MFPKNKFQIIYDFLHFDGKEIHRISMSQHNELMGLCDGYGKLTIVELRFGGLLWDWSHVRDSSDEALEVVYQKLVEWGLAQ